MSGLFLYAQDKPSEIIVQGKISDSSSGEALSGASLYIVELKQGAVAEEDGVYRISLPDLGIYTLQVSHIGYKSQTIRISSSFFQVINIKLEGNATLKEVVVTAKTLNENITRLHIGVEKLDIIQIRQMPAFLGEVDVIKAIQMLPGVHSSGEGGTGFIVRGGYPDQNLILLDNAPVYNASHLLGFFSVFNNDVISGLELYKGDIPLKYGGRLSSLLDIHTVDRTPDHVAGSGGIGLISNRLVLEGPLGDKTSWLVGARRSYADQFLRLSNDKSVKDLSIYFYDLNAKLTHRFSSRDVLSLNTYYGKDVFGADIFGLNYGNWATTLTWKHTFSEKINARFIVNMSNYKYGLQTDIDGATMEWNSDIAEMMIRSDFTHTINKRINLSYGLTGIVYEFTPGIVKTPDYGEYILPSNYAYEHVFYLSNDHSVTDKLTLRYGLRWISFHNIGKATVYTYTEDNQVSDSVKYGSGKVYNIYNVLEPRIGLVLTLTKHSSFKANFSHNTQFMQLANSSSSGSPLDIWFLAGPEIKPQKVDIFSAGYFLNLNRNKLETSVELYYKSVNNLIDFVDHADLVLNKHLEKEVLVGKGKAYGIELMVKKNTGRVNGFFNYTLSHSERTIPGINNGKTYLSPFDKPHNLKILLNYQLSSAVTFSATWMYATGTPATYPSGRFKIVNDYFPIYSGRNDSRKPDYHRLDLSCTILVNPRSSKKWRSEWNISIYNAYGRKNPYMITYDHEVTGTPFAQSTYLFGIIPSVTYNFKF